MFIRLPAFVLVMLHMQLLAAQETTRAVASYRYEDPSIGERIFIGSNYRDVWAMPVTAKVFHLNKEKGGLVIKGPGGGMQTKSLHLEDKAGRKWVLRSIDKSVDKAMEAEGIRNKLVRNISQKMVSAAQPYGALTVPPMAKALGIISTDPELFFVPDDPALGDYRSMFANTLCLLEQRQPVLYEGDEVVETEQMFKDLGQHKAYRLDAMMLLQARLLDMLTGDWDRHDDQWKWAYHRQENGVVMIYPIPRDHDQAYFNSTGLFINTARLINVHMVVGFRKNMKLKALNYKAWHFDKTLLKGLSEEDWRSGIRSFQSKMTDEVLEDGVQALPPEVYAAHGKDLYRLLKSRRDSMFPAVMCYYHFLQRHPRKVKKEEKKERIKAERAKRTKHEE